MVIGLAFASVTPAPAEDLHSPRTYDGIEEIVVTTRKREERLLDIPVSVSVFSGDEITPAGLRNIADIARMTPGLSFNVLQGGELAVPVIRGLTSLIGEPNVGFFIDGVYQASRTTMPMLLGNGIERIEVAKGPQAALYGRNTFAGAVNYVTRRPGDEFHGQVETSFGSDGLQDYRFNLSGPIGRSKFGYRVGALWTMRDGYYRNELTGSSLDERETKGYSGALTWDPTEAFDLAFTVGVEDTGNGDEPLRFVENNFGFFAPLNDFQVYAGEVPNFRTGYAVTPGGIDRDYLVSSLAINWDFGPARLSAITGYNDLDYRRAVDDDFSATEYHYRTTELAQEEWSQEVRLTSDTDRRLNWMAGVYGYFFDDRTEIDSAFQSIYAFLGGVNSVIDQRTEEFAVFGSIGYDITDALALTFSGRYQNEEKKVAASDTDRGSMAVSGYEGSNNWNAFLPRLALDWEFSNTQMVYASYTRSQKSGGFNVTTRSGVILPDERTYGPEKSDNYEFGWKSDLAGGRVMTTLALYYINWDDQIVRALGQTFATLNTNAGQSASRGFELETLARPTDRIDIRFGLAYTNAKYDEYFFGALDRLGLDPVLDGVPLQWYSKWTTNIDFGYTQPGVVGDWDWFGRFDWDWRDRQNVVPTGDAWAGASSRLNLRTGLGNARWTVTLWARNVLDNDTANTALFASNPAVEAQFATNQRNGLQVFQALVTSPDPRSWGVTANVQF